MSWNILPKNVLQYFLTKLKGLMYTKTEVDARIPTDTNQLTNGAGFITSSGSCNYANSAGSAIDNSKIPITDRGHTVFCVDRGNSHTTSMSGYWAAMLNTASAGSPVLPSSGWWHVISMDWDGAPGIGPVTDWCSQLALPTQDQGSDPNLHFRVNISETNIDSSSWVKVANDADTMKQGPWWSMNDGHNIDDAEPNMTHFAYPAHGAPAHGPFITICDKGASNYRMQFLGWYGGNDLYFRTKNGDANAWNPWHKMVYDGFQFSPLYFTYGKIRNEANQYLNIQASGEDYYSAFLGVRDARWNFAPQVDAQLSLGSQSFRWGQIFSNSGTINTSDRNAKKDIEELDEFAKTLIMSLKPVSYKFKDGNSGRTHFGMIAQDIEDSFDELGITATDLAAFCKDQKYDNKIIDEGTENAHLESTPIEGEYIYGLRYEEFIAPLIKTVQIQQQEIEELKHRIDILEGK